MQAIHFTEPGNPQTVLKCGDIPSQSPGPGEVLVKMLASPINPSDLMFITGKYTTKPQLPQVVGFEGVGIVEESGGGLRGRFFRGKRVIVLNQKGGTWAEQTVLPSSQVVPVSLGIDDLQAATAFVNPMTAWMLTRHLLQIPKNAWLIQTAAASVVGRMINRLAEKYGFNVFNIVRSARSAEACRAVGARHVMVWNAESDDSEQLQSEVQSTIGNAPLTFAIDPVGGKTGSAVLRCLTDGGRFVGYGSLSGESLDVPIRLMMTRQLKIETFWLGHQMKSLSLPKKLKIIQTVHSLIASGELKTPIASTYPLSQFQTAVDETVTGTPDGKVVFQMGE